MATSNTAPTAGAIRVLAAGSAVLGPCGAWLYESGRIDAFGLAYFLGLWMVVAMALGGLVVGVYAVRRRVLVFGLASILLNTGVAALYGFLGLFFGLGGSR